MTTKRERHHTTSQIVAPTIRIYEQGATTFLQRWISRRKRPPALLLDSLTRLPKHSSILDLGCGGAQDARVLHAKGFRVVGMDLTTAFLRAAQSTAPSVPLVLADMRDMPFRDASFDAVWAAACLMHVPKSEAAQVLKRLSRIVCPGGMLAATVTYGTQSRILTDGWMPGRYFARWQRAEWARVVEQNGWTIDSLRVVSNQERKGRWLNLVARRAM
ncbi:MAG: class I SAM-dependent methyltransferase [Nitrospira sp.]|nr:class I SAM-dependent methyltransferase [Nitrospira sp.]